MRTQLRNFLPSRFLVLLVMLASLSNIAKATITSSVTPTSVSVCAGTSVTLTNTAAGAVNWQWEEFNGVSWSTVATGTSTYTFTAAALQNGHSFRSTADDGTGFGPYSNVVPLTVTSVPSTPSGFSGNQSPCAGTSVTYSVTPVAGATSYSWSYTGSGASFAGSGSSVTVTYSTSATSGNLQVSASNACGTSGTLSTAISVQPLPSLTGPLSGTAVLCANAGATTYTVAGDANVTSFHWAYSGTGVSFSNLTASPSNTFTFGPSATSGTVSVYGTNACGTTATVTYSVTVNPATPVAFSISGTSPVCQGQNGVSYSVPANANVSTYSWSYSGTGANITGNNTNSISINFSNTATSGTLSLTETNACGSTTSTFAIVVNAQPTLTGPISGTATLCQNAGATTYTVAGDANVTTFNWSYTGTGVTFSNTTATGSNSLNFGPSATSGILSVYGSNACGNTSTVNYSITVNPATPVAFTINGTSPVCQGTNGVTFSVPSNPAVSTYAWAYTGTGATITGNNTNSITVNFGPTATSGNITLTESNTCGSTNGTFAVAITNSPTLTGPISGSATVCQGVGATSYTVAGGANITTYNWSYTGTGVSYSSTTATGTNSLDFGPNATSGILSVYGTNSCGNTSTITYSITVNPAAPVAFSITGTSPVCQGQNGVTFSVPSVAGVTYAWGYTGAGATITGNNTNTITVNFGASATSGNITLTESNTCGSQNGTFAVTVNSTPVLTGPLSGTSPVCQNAAPVTFTAAGGTGITTYNWSYSGTGTSFSNATATNTNAFTFGPSATSGTISVTGTNTCGTTAPITMAVTVNPAAPTAFSITGTASVCQGQTGVSYFVPSVAGVTYTWAYTGTGATITGNNTNSITVNFSGTATSGNITLTESNTCGSQNGTYAVTVNATPTLTGPLTGTSPVCQNAAPVTYTATGGANITTYNWAYTGTGVSFSNATGTNTNSFTFGPSATSGTISVTGTNTCGTTAPISMAVTVNPAAPVAFTITGTTPVCQGQTGVVFSVPSVAGVTYTWAYTGGGATITGNNTNTISVDFNATATSGNITLTETNSCGSQNGTYAVTVNPAATLTGPLTGTNTVCQNAAPVTYTANGGAGITTYNWSYSGTGVSFSNATATNTNSFTFGPTATSGTITVTGTGACGTTAPITMAITVNPAAPVAFTITGNSNVCQSTTGNVYFVPAVAGVTYTWSYTGTGATINNNNTNSVSIDFNNAATSGTLQLTETNACGTQSNTFAITVGGSPTLTGPLTGTNPVCQNAGVVTYTATGGANITSYTWAYSGTGVSFSNTTATNTNNFTFGPSATSGTLSVYGTSTCGTSPTLTMAINVNPAAPNAFAITGTTPVCQGQTGVSYSVPADPNVTTWTWAYTGSGATINNNNTHAVTIDFSNTATAGNVTLTATNTCGTQNGTFAVAVNQLPTLAGPLSGTNPVCQGVGATTYTVAGGANITTYNWAYTGTGVSFSNTTAANNNSFNIGASATSGTISVTGTNACGTTAAVTLPLVVNPSAPVAFTITGTPSLCAPANNVAYSVPANANVNTYNWTYSGTGATISGNGTNAITINFAANATSGTLQLDETNFCGTTSNTYAITVTGTPATPGAIAGTTAPCQGSTGNGYSVAAVAGATTYTWTYSGTGATINGNGTNSVTIDFDNTATSGTLSVTAGNACGTSAASTLALSMQPGAFQPGNFTTSSTTVCAGASANYVVPNVIGATYNWTYSGTGASISGQGTNAVTVTFANNATSGTLSVTATTVCGTSAPRSIGVTITPIPSTPASFLSSSATVCQGQSGVSYAVTPDPAATSYLWSYSGSGATINGNGSSVTIDFNNTATSGTLSVSSVNACGTSSALTMAITVTPLPAQPGAIAGNAAPCQGTLGVAYSVTNDPNIVTYNWSYSGTGATIGGAGNSITIDFANNATSGTLTVTGTNTCGTSVARTLTINVSPLPTQPGNFTASSNTVCQGQTGVLYTVPNVAGNTYTWTYSGSGVTGLGSTTNSATLDFSATATSGTLSVTTTNACGTSTARTLAITVNSVPATPGAITGTTPVCAGANGVSYSIAAVPTATSYTWSYSGTGATINGTGTSITISFANNATSGTLSVTANNTCGSSTASTLAITVTPIPSQPSAIAGTNPVCAGTNGNVYTVTNDPNATSYTWSYSGAGATLTGTTNSVSIDFSASATSGVLTVTANNACGTSTAQTSNITVTPLPSQPGAFTQGTPTVCQGQNGVVYTVPNDPSVTYTWTYTVGTGATISGTGNSVSINFSNTATSGILNVTATNACGTSTARTMNITVNPLPTAPGAITGSTTVCQGQNGVAYSVTNDPTVTYTWSYTGSGGNITGNGNSILISFSNTATSGDVTVTATNACGTSTATTLTVTVNPLPNQPSVISGSTTACAGSNGNAYSVTADPTITTYNWSYTGLGATVVGAGNAITVNFANNATSGDLTVTGTNTCGTSIARTLHITINPQPNTPSAITGAATVCEGSNGNVYSVTNDPSVTYTWTYSGGGATINGSGSTVTIDFAVGATAGTLSVTATNGCGTSTASTLNITVNPIPAAPGAISGNATACAGSLGNAYSVTNVAGTTYNWTYSGTGATITGNGTSAISINFTNNATGGTLSVTATTACGTSTASTLAITINPLPAQPSVITGPTPVCQGTNGNTYSVTNDPTVTYTWTYSGAGATLTPAGNTVSINYSATATSGTLTVTATDINGCGTTTRTKSITINPLPAVPGTPVGTTPVCQGQNGVLYTVLNDPTVTSYTWSYSGTGATINAVGNNASINFSATATGGNLTVTATNACGTSAPSNPLAITVNSLPTTPGAITGTSPVCQGQNGVAYSVPLDPTVTYTWSYSGTGATINGSTNAITINFSNTATSGNLSVIASNGCGTSSPSTFTILVNPLPNQPAAFSVFTDSVCAGTNGVVYTVPNDPSVTYNWNYSGGGATINGTGNSVTVDYSLAATSGTLSVTATNTCGTSIARTRNITIKPLPVTPGAITGLATVCQGQNGVVYSVTNDPTVTYTWTYSGTGVVMNAVGNTVTINYGVTATSGTLSVTATNSCGTTTPSTLAITVNPLPSQPSNITGTSPVCQGQTGVAYSVTPDPTVTYTWTYSGTGATINGTTDAVTVDFSNTATSGTLSVTATAINGCGTSIASNFPIQVNPLPAQPAAFITSSATVCQGQNGVVYTVPNDPTVTYTWTYSGTGATIAGSGNSVALTFSNTATSGTLSVTANNACGVSTARTIAITVNPLPTTPGAITGTTPVCQGDINVAYSVTNDPTVTYNWSYSGLNTSIVGSGNAIGLTFGTNATSGTLSVTATNACGTSSASTMAITVNPLPLQPSTITGPATVCQGQTGVSYQVLNDPTITSYTWTYSGTGATITGTTNAVTINFSNTATSGNLTVIANNSCGASLARVMAITVNPLPNQPAAFVTSTNPVCQGQSSVIYEVPDDPTVTYTWTYSGTGATITGTGHLVSIDFSNSATSGNLNVTATNGCGTSIPRTLAITVNPLPANPGAFTAGPVAVCQGQNGVTYTVPAAANATSYSWSYSGTGATFPASTVTPTVNINFSTVATSGTLSVVGVNACGTSLVARTIAITVNPLPLKPDDFTASNDTVCQGQNGVVYTVPNVAGNTYTWTYSGTGVTGFNTTNSVSLNFSNTATSGTLSVTTTNGCGTSQARTLAIQVNTLPTQPSVITGLTTVCQAQSNVLYSVTNVPTVTSYTWTYSGTGAVITGTGSNVSINFAANATSGTLSVIANNACGASTARTLAITVNPIPAQPSTITGLATVCQGATQTYSVTNVPGTTYSWNYTGTGVTGFGTGSSVNLTFSATATAGTLSVTANTACGQSIPRTLNITVNPLPQVPGNFTIMSNQVCQGQNNVVYQVPLDITVTAYNWSYTGGVGATITTVPPNNTANVNFSNTATSGTIQVTATNGCGTSAARTVAVTVNPLPNQPAAFTTSTAVVCQGQNGVVYTVPNDPTVTYTWSYSGTGATILNSNTNTATVNFATNATSGTLSVIAHNNCGNSTARTINITVNPLPNEPLPFTNSTATVCQGQTGVIYTVPLDPTVTYTWSYSGTGATITGVGNSVSINYSNTATSGLLSVTATNGCGVSTPLTLYVTVKPLPVQPGAITGPTPVCQGDQYQTYSVPYDSSVSYTWQYSGTGATILGTGNLVVIDFSTTATSGTLSVTATALNGCGTTAPSTLAITVNQLPRVTSSPVNAVVCEGFDTSFTMTATGTGLVYQWQVDSTGTGFVDIVNNATYAGATTDSLHITAPTASMNGFKYRAFVSGTCYPGDTTGVAILTVNTSPVLTSQPVNTIVCAGSNASFSVGATGTALTYQWEVNDGTGWANVPAAAPYSGVNSATLNITAATAGMNGYQYRVIVSGTCAPSQTSGAAFLNVNFPPIITIEPSATTVTCANAPADISVVAIGANLAYQWQVNNGTGWANINNPTLYTGVNSATLHINAVGPTMSGFQYRVIVSGACAPPDTSNASTVSNQTQVQWTGLVNTHWSEPGNWACGVLPTATTVVTITATVPNMPEVDIPTAICDSLIIDPGAKVSFIGTGNVLEIKGSIVNNGTFDASLGEVRETGNGTQSIPGGSYAIIRLNGSGDKMINANTTVTQNLVLTNGYMTIGNSDLTIATTGTIMGGNTASFVVTNGTGRLINTNIGLGGRVGAVLFPVGTASTSYTPLTMINLGTADDFMVNVLDGIYSAYVNNVPSGPSLTSDAVGKTWILDEANPGGSNVVLTLQWNSADELPGFNRSECFLSHYTAPNWTPGTTGPAFGSDPYSVTLSGITTFSPFGVGSAGSPLVVGNVTGNDNDDVMTLYPNPVTGSEIYVKFENAPKGDVVIRIMDMQGKVIAENKVNTNQYPGGVIPVKIEDLAHGAYMMQMADKNNRPIQSIKFNKQ
ncbi:MAG: T9SS type A sorting domain-containing protein [Bacteroidetes bacterium]|nr:T9SS type A sorting domain-containing protein [Bacteroidota bacterium]